MDASSLDASSPLHYQLYGSGKIGSDVPFRGTQNQLLERQALMYPLLVACKSIINLRRAAAQEVVDKVRQHSGGRVDEAQLVSNELIRVAILWHEMWHETSEEASRLYFESLVTPLGNESEVAAMHVPVEHSPEQNDEPLSNTWCDAASTEMSSTVAQVDSFSSMILKSLGGGLVKILESMQVSKHKKILKVTESTFESFRSMEVDCEAFCEGVKEYINCNPDL